MSTARKNTVTYADFDALDIRSGVVIKSEPNDAARKPALKVWVDFGDDIGVMQTSAQITQNYTAESLIGRCVMGCLNLGDKKIAGFTSQFLLLGLEDKDGHIILAEPERPVPPGRRLH